MSRLGDILDKMITAPLLIYQYEQTLPALSAGAKGFFELNHGLTFDDPDSLSTQVVSIKASTASISGTSGLQLTPINVTAQKLYVQYYAPAAVAAGLKVVYRIYKMRGSGE